MGRQRTPRLFPFSPHSANGCILKSVLQFIYGRSYVFSLPSLSEASWESLCSDPCERERLEFVGDSLLSSAIAQEQMRIFPDGTPGMYTATRSILTTNAMFAHLMARLGLYKCGDPVRLAADAFEAIIGAYHAECGPTSLQEWISQYFSPLIIAAETGYRRSLSCKRRSLTRYEHDQAMSRDGRKYRALIRTRARLHPHQPSVGLLPPQRSDSSKAKSITNKDNVLLTAMGVGALQDVEQPGKDGLYRSVSRQPSSSPIPISVKRNPIGSRQGNAADLKNGPIPIPIHLLQSKRFPSRPTRPMAPATSLAAPGSINNPIIID